MVHIQIENMTREEKLAAMELLWQDLTRVLDCRSDPRRLAAELKRTR
jgi:hypothetical protein